MLTERLSLKVHVDDPSWQHFGFGRWDIVERASSATAGYVSISMAGWPNFEPWWGVPELSLDIAPAFQRRGYGTEVARAVFHWAFNERTPPLERIWGVTTPDNTGAQKLNDRLGMRLLRQITRDARTDQPGVEPIEVLAYEIRRSDL